MTLPETLLTIAGQPLFAGFDAGVQPSRSADRSAIEALNVAQLWDALGLASREAPLFDLINITVQALEEMNSAITRGTSTPYGLRTHAVAIGHQRVLLPMPDEVPVLAREYVEWLISNVHALDVIKMANETDTKFTLYEHVLGLACDAHTRFVFVHPFSDGNGRLARTLAALVLRHFELPAPMIPRILRAEYMSAVSSATADKSYSQLATIFAAAVRRSLACQVQLSVGSMAVPEVSSVMGADGSSLASAISRSGCLSPPNPRVT